MGITEKLARFAIETSSTAIPPEAIEASKLELGGVHSIILNLHRPRLK
jgi:hypothetical protein